MRSITRDMKTGSTRSFTTRGLLAIAFGVVMLVWPGPTVLALTYMVGAMAALDGLLGLRAAVNDAGRDDRWWLGFTGVAGVVVGVTAVAWPEMSALGLLYLVGAWALVLGGTELAGAFFGSGRGTRRHALALHGVITFAFGVVMWSRPGAGALVLISLIATLAIARGVALCGIAHDLRRADDAVAPTLKIDAQTSAA